MSSLRVALVAGTLSRGGAEQQLVYMAAALANAGAEVRVYSLTRGELHEQSLGALGLAPIWVGRPPVPALRVAALAVALARFRPHIVQAAHFFVNLYATISGRLIGAASIGTIRSDVCYELRTNPRWGRRLLLAPPDLITNSHAAKHAAEAQGRDPATVHVIGNVIDLADFDRRACEGLSEPPASAPIALAIANLLPAKRLDRFLEALALARQRGGPIVGMIAGEGPERPRLEARARSLGLLPDGVRFLGERDDVPALLRAAAFLVLASDHEGFPNVVLEAMAAGRPVLATRCGDIDRIVHEGSTGFVVPAGDAEALADRMRLLAAQPERRRQLGEAARLAVERSNGHAALADRLMAAYQTIARRGHRPRLAEALR